MNECSLMAILEKDVAAAPHLPDDMLFDLHTAYVPRHIVGCARGLSFDELCLTMSDIRRTLKDGGDLPEASLGTYKAALTTMCALYTIYESDYENATTESRNVALDALRIVTSDATGTSGGTLAATTDGISTALHSKCSNDTTANAMAAANGTAAAAGAAAMADIDTAAGDVAAMPGTAAANSPAAATASATGVAPDAAATDDTAAAAVALSTIDTAVPAPASPLARVACIGDFINAIDRNSRFTKDQKKALKNDSDIRDKAQCVLGRGCTIDWDNMLQFVRTVNPSHVDNINAWLDTALFNDYM